MSLTIKNLQKKFGEKTIFSNFSYTFEDKGIYAVIGKSGAGKTTLLRIISGLDKDFSGTVDGGNIGAVSFAFQEYRLFPELTALENVYFANSEEKSEADARDMLLKLGFCDADLELLPYELSGGMKQRVSLARAFIKDSPILLLDEPTKELDSENSKRVIDLIKDNGNRRLVILVSHNEEDILSLNAEIIKIQ